jgi:hypothetical protein
VGDGSPGSREAEGEGGEGFYIAQSGRCPDLLVIWGGDAYEICSKALVVRSRRFSIAHSSQRLTKGFQITPQPYKLGGGPDARRIARTKKLAEPALRTPALLSPLLNLWLPRLRR